MKPNQTGLTLCHQDIRIGWSHHVPCHLTHAWKPAVAAAVRRAGFEPSAHFEVPGTPFMVQVTIYTAADGNLGLWVASRTPLGGGKIPAKTPLYSASLACQEATAPLAWRPLKIEYLKHMLESPAEARFHALGLMPRTFPWVCGFPKVIAGHLTKEEWNALIIVVRLAALELLERGRRAVREAAANGIVPAFDPDLFLELKDWTS